MCPGSRPLVPKLCYVKVYASAEEGHLSLNRTPVLADKFWVNRVDQINYAMVFGKKGEETKKRWFLLASDIYPSMRRIDSDVRAYADH